MVDSSVNFNTGGFEDTPEEKAAGNFSSVEFMTIEVGDNLIRLIGSYIFRNMHYVQTGKLKHIICAGDNCPLCEHETPKMKYFINILDRKDGKIKVYNFPPTIKKKFQNLFNKFGDLSQYDVVITRTGKDFTNTKYEVLPAMNSVKLTDTEIENIKNNIINLNEVFKIPTPEEVNNMVSGEPIESDSNKSFTSTNKVEKECYGISFNPMQPNCKTCELCESCKKLLIESLQQEGN